MARNPHRDVELVMWAVIVLLCWGIGMGILGYRNHRKENPMAIQNITIKQTESGWVSTRSWTDRTLTLKDTGQTDDDLIRGLLFRYEYAEYKAKELKVNLQR